MYLLCLPKSYSYVTSTSTLPPSCLAPKACIIYKTHTQRDSACRYLLNILPLTDSVLNKDHRKYLITMEKSGQSAGQVISLCVGIVGGRTTGFHFHKRPRSFKV